MKTSIIEKESDALVEIWGRMFKPLSEQLAKWIDEGPNTIELGAFCGYVVVKAYYTTKKNQDEAFLVIERFHGLLKNIIVDALESSFEDAEGKIHNRKEFNDAFNSVFSERYKYYAAEIAKNVSDEEDFVAALHGGDYFNVLSTALCSVMAEVHGKPTVGSAVQMNVFSVIKLTHCLMVISLDDVVVNGFFKRLFS